MQLLLDTEEDISIQPNMSTIQQESLKEKFSSTSPIQNVCNDIISNDKCVNQDIVVKPSDESVEVQSAQHTETSQKRIIIDKNRCEELPIYGKIESTENKENGEIENSYCVCTEDENVKSEIANKSNTSLTEKTPNVQNKTQNVNSEIAIKSDTPVQEPMEIEPTKVETKSDSEIVCKTQKKIEKDCGLDIGEPDEQVLEDSIEEPVKENNETEQAGACNDVNYVNKNKKQANINIVETVKEYIEVTHNIEEKNLNENAENMDVTTEDLDIAVRNVSADKTVPKVEVTSEKIDTTEDNVEMDVAMDDIIDFNVSTVKGKTVEGDAENSEMDVTFEEKQEDVTSDITDNCLEEEKREGKIDGKIQDTVDGQVNVSEDKDKILQSNENSETDIIFQKQDEVKIDVAEYKIKNSNEVTNEMNVSLAEHHDDKCIITKDNFQEQVKIGKENNEMEMTFVERKIVEHIETDNNCERVVKSDNVIGNVVENQDDIEENKKENNEMVVTVEEQVQVSTSIAEEVQKLHKEKSDALVEEKDNQEEADNYLKEIESVHISIDNAYNKEISELEVKVDEQSQKVGKHVEETCEKMDKYVEKPNEISAIIERFETEDSKLSPVKEDITKLDPQTSVDKSSIEVCVSTDITANYNKENKDKRKINDVISIQPVFVLNSETQKNNIEDTTNIANDLDQQNNKSEEISLEIEKPENENYLKNVENEAEADKEKQIVNTEQEVKMHEVIKESEKTNADSAVTKMDIDEVVNVVNEKVCNEHKNTGNDTLVEKIEPLVKSTLKRDEPELKVTTPHEVASNNTSGTDQSNLTNQKPKTGNVEEKKKLTHISKLSNTLDILSDEEEETSKEEPQKEISEPAAHENTSINIDDDDDILLIDEESSTIDDKNETESILAPENEVMPKDETTVETKAVEAPTSETSDSKTESTPPEVVTPSDTEMKTTDEPKPDITAEDEKPAEPEPRKPLLQANFLKSCKKNLVDMTRDELEEFCVLKIVESVVDRSHFCEMKSQLKAMAQNIEEYKKKAAALTKQNRDLQVVVKSIQEEQKKNTNMPITPLKITRSVGMQVLMTDKVGVRKKVTNNKNVTNNNPRQGKAQNTVRLQKMLANPSNPPPIPVPRLVPAVNNSSINNMKLQSPTSNAQAKMNNSPIQSVANGLTTVQKAEKRPHSRMQQNNSVTVDLTDDEPPAKVVTKNIATPVRLVPPQNLLAPHRQPFGQNINTPRKVYIPISGSQAPVGVRPGQTIMLKTLSPQSPRQRLPTPGLAKPNQNPNTVRMQRLQSRHPAPLPESVKQYQPTNWKALPPAPELKLSKVENGIVISWKIDGYVEENYEEIASYQLYAYQETTSPPSTALWKKIGDVKALALPMACTLTQFMAGYKYYFAVRAVDVRSRLGPFSLPGSILLLNKM